MYKHFFFFKVQKWTELENARSRAFSKRISLLLGEYNITTHNTNKHIILYL